MLFLKIAVVITILLLIFCGLIGIVVCLALKGMDDEPYYKCRTNTIKECGDMCCMFCLGANECKYACKGDPSNCGMQMKG